jgi:hypothetical protein
MHDRAGGGSGRDAVADEVRLGPGGGSSGASSATGATAMRPGAAMASSRPTKAAGAGQAMLSITITEPAARAITLRLDRVRQQVVRRVRAPPCRSVVSTTTTAVRRAEPA